MKSKDPRVVITGLGIVAPNGYGIDEFTAALRSGTSGIRFIPKLKELNFGCQVGGVPQGILEKATGVLSNTMLVAMNEGMIYASLAAIEAFKDAGLSIPRWDEDLVDEDTGAVVGTGIGGIDVFADKVYQNVVAGQVRRCGGSIVEQIMASAVSARLGGLLALGNQVTTNSSACSTGLEAIIMGAQRIKMGLAKRMVVGGVEGTSPFIWAGFDSLRVLCRKFNDQPTASSRPMSASSAGFVPGGGAGILIVEDLDTAIKRGARIYAEILGSSINSGGMRFGGSMTAPSARGVKRCVREAVLQAKIKPADIQYINGHLTATFADPVEVKNWSEGLELEPSKLPLINSTKSLIGHTLGAAGAIETIATVLQLKNNFVHASLNCEDLHPELNAYSPSIVRETTYKSLEIAAKASFGFGDVNSCMILKNWRKNL